MSDTQSVSKCLHHYFLAHCEVSRPAQQENRTAPGQAERGLQSAEYREDRKSRKPSKPEPKPPLRESRNFLHKTWPRVLAMMQNNNMRTHKEPEWTVACSAQIFKVAAGPNTTCWHHKVSDTLLLPPSTTSAWNGLREFVSTYVGTGGKRWPCRATRLAQHSGSTMISVPLTYSRMPFAFK